MKLYSFFLVACLTLLAGIIPSQSFAHLAGGEDKVVKEYVVDFGYDPEMPSVGTATLLAFHVRAAETPEHVDYTHVWVRISHDDQIVSAVNVAQEDAGTNYLYTFPEAGEYTIDLQFKDDETLVVGTEFTLRVAEKASQSDAKNLRLPIIVFIILLVGAAIGSGAKYAVGRKQ